MTPDWGAAHGRLVASLRDLIRIPSINPPDPARPDGELEAARWLAGALDAVGIASTVYEPVPGRGSVVGRLRGDGSGGLPLLLLSHLDVVPATPEGWTRDPFAGEILDGWLYGRGAVDMKNLVAMELEVMRLLADEARAAGRDPSSDPVPGLTRDLIFASTADEEAGGFAGAGWLASEHPDQLRAAGAINEAGAIAVAIGDRRIYPIGVTEKSIATYKLTFHGTWGHGSMPRDDNAILLASAAALRLSDPWPYRVTDVTRGLLEGAVTAATNAGVPEMARILRLLATGDARTTARALDALCDPVYIRVLDAMLRDTLSTTVLHGGIKYNVIPGIATLEIDCRRLPGTTEEEMAGRIRDRLGPDLAAVTDVDLVIASDAIVQPYDDPSGLYPILEAAVRDHDADGTPVPAMMPFGTDSKHLQALGVPVYGFSPLRQPVGETYLDRYHAIDERVSIEGLRWGLPVLYDAVRRFCA
jgi:acetylornithine deacetylase/succinyl-diaminopimelate desuccinylase-like protein